MSDDDPRFLKWLNEKGLKIKDYYLVVGRFVPENNFETMIREFMNSKTNRSLVLVTNVNDKFLNELEEKLHFKDDKRIKFVGTVYDKELLKKIRECAFAYLHGHEVGGTNPSLLEALGSTNLNLLFKVGFNVEVGKDSSLYWGKNNNDLSALISRVDGISEAEWVEFGNKAKQRIIDAYSWEFIGDEYKKILSNY